MLDGEDLETPIELDEDAYYVCCYTCETVVYETVARRNIRAGSPLV